ncbi:MAG: hypothetical protein ACRCYV_09680 [Aeromonas sp.]
MSLLALSHRLPYQRLAAVLLGLLLLCNLSFCMQGSGAWPALTTDDLWHAATTASTVPPAHTANSSSADLVAAHAMAPAANACHAAGSDMASSECPMASAMPSSDQVSSQWLALLALLLLPLLLFALQLQLPSQLDAWLRSPFLRLRGAHPPSWPRRHLMLCHLTH